MIANVQTQEVVLNAVEIDETFVMVQDMDLMFVGGGTETAVVF